MMAGNPSWYPMFSPSQQPSTWLYSPAQSFLPSQYVLGSSSLPLNPLPENHEHELPQSWSQVLFGGFLGDEGTLGLSHYQHKKLENWEDPILNPSLSIPVAACMKQEISPNSSNLYGQVDEDSTFQAPRSPWSHAFPASSARSCVTCCNSNSLDFAYIKGDGNINNPDQSYECNSSATYGVTKKARVQPTTSQPTVKVRKEKLGDRITTLHQLVSPFGKTDTASVLLEAIGYIRFLQDQIEALSSPYLGTASSNIKNQQHVQGARDSVFSQDPCHQLLNDIRLKRKGTPGQDSHDNPRSLRSRGLCLVPITCTSHIGSEINGAEFWDPGLGGGI